MKWLAVEQANLLAAIHHAADLGMNKHAWQLASTLTTYLDRQGHWHDLAVSQDLAIHAVRRIGDETGQANARRGRANAWALRGELDDAAREL
jgi:hypothetical protein